MTDVIRTFTLPNGDKIVSLRESTFRAGVKAANEALKAVRVAGPDYAEDMATFRKIRRDHAPLLEALAAYDRVNERDGDILKALADE